INPVPKKPLKMLVGGHVDAAMRRAVALGDGWMHGGGDAEGLDPLLQKLNKIRKELGRDKTPFEIHVVSMDAYTVDGIRRLEDQGVTHVIVGFRNTYDPSTVNQPLEEKIAALNHYAENVIHKVR